MRNGAVEEEVAPVTPLELPGPLEPRESIGLEEASTADLVREAFAETKELVRIEIALAKDEARLELRRVKAAAIGFGVSLAAVLVTLSVLATALVLGLGGAAVVALLVAAGVLVIAAVAALVAYALLPKNPFARTRERLLGDLAQLAEHVA